MPAEAPAILHREGGLVVAQIGMVCVAVWRADSTVARVGRQSEALGRVVRQAPGQAAFFCVIEPSSAPPNDKAREASSAMLRSYGTDLVATAVVIEGSGFRASIVRSVASGIVWLARSRSKVPVSYFADVEAGATWMAGHVPLRSLEDFIRSIEATRELLAGSQS